MVLSQHVVADQSFNYSEHGLLYDKGNGLNG